MVSASQMLLWRVRPETESKCIDVAHRSIGSVESTESIGSFLFHTLQAQRWYQVQCCTKAAVQACADRHQNPVLAKCHGLPGQLSASKHISRAIWPLLRNLWPAGSTIPLWRSSRPKAPRPSLHSCLQHQPACNRRAARDRSNLCECPRRPRRSRCPGKSAKSGSWLHFSMPQNVNVLVFW